MAVNNNKQEPNNNANESMSAFASNGNNNQKQQQQQNGFSFRNMGNMTRSAMGRTPASEVLSKLNRAMSEVYSEAADKSFEVTLLPIDLNATTSLNVSVLVVALRYKNAPECGVAHHTLIVEASIEAPVPRFEMINGTNVEIIRTVGDAYDSVMMNEVSSRITAMFPQSKQLPVLAEVVPRDFNITDQAAIYSLASNALFACSSELETNTAEFTDLNLVNAERDATLTVRTSFGNGQSTNAVMQPVRSDVVIELSAAPINQNQGQQQQVERTSPVARVAGFVDLVWDPVAMNQNAFYQQQQQSYVRYAARFVATQLESASLLTIPAQLLAIIPGLALRENNAWVQAFKRSTFSNGVDMRDIGAVGIEANFMNDPSGVGTRIDTKADSFRPEHMHKLLASTIKPGLIMSMDIPECGPDSWYNDVFSAAAEGNKAANQAIINAGNVLTNGNLKKYFNDGDQVAQDECNRIHLGHYTDANGVRKDLRDLDYLAVLNLVGEKDIEVVKKWSDTFAQISTPLALRLSERKRIIQGLFSDVVFTGFARRVTFNPAFIDALAMACQDVGLVIRSVSSYADMGNYERAGSRFAGSTLMNGDAIGVFNRAGFGNNAQNNGTGRSIPNRW